MTDREARIATPRREAARPVGRRAGIGRTVRRGLRGRYAAALLLALVGGLAGGFLGWRLARPLYRATASIYVSPVAPGSRGAGDPSLLPLFEGFLNSQVQLLSTGKAARRAVGTDVWRAAGGQDDPEAARAFEERRDVVRVPGTHLVQVSFVDRDADVAVAGVHALVEAWRTLFAELHEDDEGDRLTVDDERDLVRRWQTGLEELQSLTAEVGGVEGLEIRHHAAVRLALSTEDALRSLRGAIAGGVRGPIAPAEIAAESPILREALAYLARTEAEEKVLARRLGITAPPVIALRERVATLQEGIDALARDWRRERAARGAAEPTLEALERREAELVLRLEGLQAASRELGRLQGEVREVQAANDEIERQLARTRARETDLAPGGRRPGRMQVADPGARPTAPWRDERRTWAAIGAAVGALLGFVLVLTTGLRDRRLKHAVAADDVLSDVRSLGLLPTLPSDPDDVDGVRAATHFTHQIRTLLEITHARDRSACVGVTGPGTGSGATTLTAALGLSFASTGSRTLLVDAEPEGRGLTKRVVRMLVDHVRHAGRDGDAGQDAPGYPLLSPLVHRSTDAENPTPEELEQLLIEAVGRLGARRARETGRIRDLFSLADLLDDGASRDRLALRLVEILASEGDLRSGAPARWIPARIRESGFPWQELDPAELEHQLYSTGIETLRFLPLHGADLEGRTSVAVMAGILTLLRDRFDVVLVDPGPVPGTDGASLVAVQADSLVLVVSREDEGPDAERALAHLAEIRARVAGVVFNRAAQKDIVATGRTMYVGSGG